MVFIFSFNKCSKNIHAILKIYLLFYKTLIKTFEEHQVKITAGQEMRMIVEICGRGGLKLKLRAAADICMITPMDTELFLFNTVLNIHNT